MEKEGTYAPVEVNSDPPPTPTCTCGPLLVYWGFISILTELRNPQYVGNSRVLSTLCRGMWDISRGFVPARTSGYISPLAITQDGGRRCLQKFVKSILLLFKSVHRLI